MPKLPLYKDMYKRLKIKIENELYKKGSLLPTEEELQQEYGVSRTTVRKAVALLHADGLVEAKQGYGTEIVKNRVSQSLNDITSVSESLRKTGKEVGVKSVYIERIRANRELSEELMIGADEPVIQISRVQTVDGAPITIAKNYIPEKFVPGILNQNKDIVSLYHYLEQVYDIKITRVEDRLSACNATFDEAIALEIEPHSALIVVRRICYCGDSPLEVDYVKIVANMYEYKNTVEQE